MPPRIDLSRRSEVKADPYASRTHRRIDLILFVLTIIILFVLLRSSAHAQDPSGSDPFWNPSGTGTGTWDTSTLNWNSLQNGTGTQSAWVNGSDAVFSATGKGGTAFTVTIANNTTISANSITVNNSGGETITATTGGGSTLSIGAGGITINSGAGAFTINGSKLSVTSATESWTNNSTSLFTVGPASGVNIGANLLTLTGTGNTTISGIISGTGGGLTKTGTGTLTLSGANTYTGATTISAGTLQLGNGGTSGSLSTSSTITDNGTFTINRSNAVSQGTGFSGSAITGTGSFVQAGSGTTTLTAANSYTGTTTVNAGTLFVNGNQTLATGTTTVNNSGTVLGGTGTIGGNVSIASSGAILEGGTGSTGQTLTIKGSLTQVSGSIIELALGPSLTHSTLALTNGGPSSFYSTQKFTFIDLGATIGTYQDIITGVTTNPGDLSGWTITNAGYQGTFSWDSSDFGIDLTLTEVPEPGTWCAAALAMGMIGYSQRRRFGRLLKLA